MRYVTIPIRKDRSEADRAEAFRGCLLAVLGLVVMVGLAVILWLSVVQAMSGPEPVETEETVAEENVAVTVRPMAVYTVSAADLWLTEYDNRINPSPLTDSEWETLLAVCDERRIAPSLALGLIYVESRFDRTARSRAGCYGLCQLNPRFFPSGLSSEENIRAGLNYLADQCERYDSTEAGLTAYNAGYDTGSREYANAVLEAAEKWEEELYGAD